jgi:poly(A) polymerase
LKLHDVLLSIQEVAKNNNCSQPLIVGGVVRDRIREHSKEINDIDLTSINGDAVDLAFACSKTLPYKSFNLYDDGHAKIEIGGISIDFSNHFIIPTIDQELTRLGIEDKTSLMREMYSRDFTINTLLQDLNFETIYDITGQGVKDIKAGVIRCPINPELTIGNDPKRILRAIRFALRFDYTIDDDLVRSIKKYRHLLKNMSPDYVKDHTNELVKLDPEKAIKMLIEYGLLSVIPMTKTLGDALIKNKLLYYAFEGKNTNTAE